MDGIEISNILKRNKSFLGVCSAEQLKNVYKDNKFVIVNSKCTCFKLGHWLCCYFKKPDNIFFDSYGHVPVYYKLINYPNGSYAFQTNQFQGKFSTTCGLYCILFVDYMTAGGTFEQFLHQFDKNNLEKNDQLVCEYVNTTYDTNFSITDLEMFL